MCFFQYFWVGWILLFRFFISFDIFITCLSFCLLLKVINNHWRKLFHLLFLELLFRAMRIWLFFWLMIFLNFFFFLTFLFKFSYLLKNLEHFDVFAIILLFLNNFRWRCLGDTFFNVEDRLRSSAQGSLLDLLSYLFFGLPFLLNKFLILLYPLKIFLQSQNNIFPKFFPLLPGKRLIFMFSIIMIKPKRWLNSKNKRNHHLIDHNCPSCWPFIIGNCVRTAIISENICDIW